MQQRQSPPIAEPLEDRRLLASWGQHARLIEQDSAALKYAKVTGAGQSVAVIDTGIDYRHPALGGGFGAKFGPDMEGMTAAEIGAKYQRPVSVFDDRDE